jgi:hypothetical protein
MAMKMRHEAGYDLYYNCRSFFTAVGTEIRCNSLSQPINLTIESEFLTAWALIGSDGKDQSCKY